MVLFIQRYFHPLMWFLLALLGLSLGQLAATSLGLWLNGAPTGEATIPETLSTVNRQRPCLLYTYPSPRDRTRHRMPSSACKKKTVEEEGPPFRPNPFFDE